MNELIMKKLVMKKRIIDSKGDMVVTPNGYNETLETLQSFVDSMHNDNVDVADIRNVLWALLQETDFHIRFRLTQGTNK